MANPVLVPAAGPQPEGVQQPAAAVSAVHTSSLYVGDLDREVTEQQLFELFSQVGTAQTRCSKVGFAACDRLAGVILQIVILLC